MRIAAKFFTIVIVLTSGFLLLGQAPAGNGAGKGKGAVKAGEKGGGAAKGKGKAAWPPEGPTPRAADGHPDLTGNWSPNAIQANVDLPGQVEGGIPYQPWAAALQKERSENISRDDPEARCLPPGVPRMTTTPYPWTILQTPKIIAFMYEGGAHVWRQVFMDGRPHNPDVVETWLGDSIGHWEGDTLVIETTGQTDKSWLDMSGVPHTNDMVVTERITRPDYGHLVIENIIHDPGAFTKDWSFTTHPSLLQGELIEYICQENNRDIEHLVGKE